MCRSNVMINYECIMNGATCIVKCVTMIIHGSIMKLAKMLVTLQ
jgi:hypothetical protein